MGLFLVGWFCFVVSSFNNSRSYTRPGCYFSIITVHKKSQQAWKKTLCTSYGYDKGNLLFNNCSCTVHNSNDTPIAEEFMIILLLLALKLFLHLHPRKNHRCKDLLCCTSQRLVAVQLALSFPFIPSAFPPPPPHFFSTTRYKTMLYFTQALSFTLSGQGRDVSQHLLMT